MNYLTHHMGEVSIYSAQHLVLVGTSLAIAILIALPAGILAGRSPRASSVLIGTFGVIYTIPSLAVLAVLVHYIGLGFWTAVSMLVIYAQYVLVRNFAAGIHSVAAAQVEAAVALGMNQAQRLWRVELPQAFPIMLGGVRIATIALISIATLAGYVNGGGLGTMIFFGLETTNYEKTVAGALPAIALAIIIDALFRLLEKRASKNMA